MPTKNTPVPPGPVAPLNLRYFWYVAPPAFITLAYRAIPPRVRGKWGRTSTSHIALRTILAGGGWSAFLIFSRPRGSLAMPSWFPESSSLKAPWDWSDGPDA